jgi:hypothetical protein
MSTATPKHSPVSNGYPISQPQFAGVGIMPSVKLAQASDRCTQILGSHNSSMFGNSSVKVKIAPPDAARSPPSHQLVTIQNCINNFFNAHYEQVNILIEVLFVLIVAFLSK